MGRDGDGDGAMSKRVGSVRFNLNFLAAIAVSVVLRILVMISYLLYI